MPAFLGRENRSCQFWLPNSLALWFERFVIVTTLTAGFIPASWEFYQPTLIDILTLAGSFGLFLTLFLLFLRYLPVVAIAEVKTVLPQANEHESDHGTEPSESANEQYFIGENGDENTPVEQPFAITEDERTACENSNALPQAALDAANDRETAPAAA